jgi:hypothetical protein
VEGVSGEPGSSPDKPARAKPYAPVPLEHREVGPREWNLWVLERIAAETEGSDPAQDEERALLLLSLRQFANASGELPPEFDLLVRDAFGAALAGRAPQGLG